MASEFGLGPSMCFQIQKVIGFSAGDGNIPTYQVQWAPAWVSGHHLIGCEHLIKEYLEKEERKKKFQSCVSTVELESENWQENTSNEDQQYCVNSIGQSADINPSNGSHDTHHEILTESTNESHEMNPYEEVFCENTVDDGDYQSISVKEEEVCGTEEYEEYQDHQYNNMSIIPGKDNDRDDEYNHRLFQSEVESNEEELEAFQNYNPTNVPWESLVATIGGQFKCLACERLFNDKSNLRQHIRTHSNERPFACSICHKSFKWNKVLKRHMATHFQVKPYQCSLCEKSYTQRTSLKSHLRHSHGQVVDDV